MKYNNEKNIKYIINKIFNGKKIKENFIVIHSSTIPFRLNHNDVKIFWKELRKFLGNKVTIIMPSFSFNFGKSKIWDYYKTKSEMGILTEYFRKKISNTRSIHPIHSVVYYGPMANKIPNHDCSSSFGKNSVWDWICNREDVLNVSVGLGLVGGAAFVHYAEELVQVPYREYVKLNGKVYDNFGNLLKKNFTYFARKEFKNKIVKNYFEPVEKDLIKNGIMTKKIINGSIVTTNTNTYQATKFLINKLKKNIFYMGNFEKKIGLTTKPV